MDWYIVIKTINGRRYRYRQKTWREGGRVHTRSEYIGPAEAAAGPAPAGQPHPGRATTSVSHLRKITAAALETLTGEQASDWKHAFEEEREGPNLVRKESRIEQVLRELRVRWTDSTDGAYYNPGEDVVNIPPPENFIDKDGQSATQAYYIVVFHELVHWTGGDGRMDRATGGWFNDEGYAREELVAELGATILMKHFGLDLGNPGRHAHYFQIWLGRSGARKAALTHAKREAQRAVRFILERGIIQT
jgi:antirestriction protein ArdC